MIPVDDLEGDDPVEVLVGTRQITGTVAEIETEPTIHGLEYKVHVDVGESTIVCSPGQLRTA